VRVALTMTTSSFMARSFRGYGAIAGAGWAARLSLYFIRRWLAENKAQRGANPPHCWHARPCAVRGPLPGCYKRVAALNETAYFEGKVTRLPHNTLLRLE
jgi:hypothetical protein